MIRLRRKKIVNASRQAIVLILVAWGMVSATIEPKSRKGTPNGNWCTGYFSRCAHLYVCAEISVQLTVRLYAFLMPLSD